MTVLVHDDDLDLRAEGSNKCARLGIDDVSSASCDYEQTPTIGVLDHLRVTSHKTGLKVADPGCSIGRLELDDDAFSVGASPCRAELHRERTCRWEPRQDPEASWSAHQFNVDGLDANVVLVATKARVNQGADVEHNQSVISHLVDAESSADAEVEYRL
jgi:hypothetical protein